MKKLFSLTAASILMATAAVAESPAPVVNVLTPIAAPAAAAIDWTGFYAGGMVSSDSGPTTAHTISTGINYNPDELDPATNYGVFAGYNKQMGSFVLGGEFAYSTGTYVGVAYPATEFDYMADIKARAGFSLGRAFVYGVVGYSFSDFRTSTDEYSATGMSAGAGLDFMVTDRVFVGAEYLTRDLHGVNQTIPNSLARIDGIIQSAAIRVGMKF